MTPRERELLHGMCNCYSVCGEDFEHTVGMVSTARGLTPDHVKALLVEMSSKYSKDQEYLELRKGIPPDSPLQEHATLITCRVCWERFADYPSLAAHISSVSNRSDASHVMWLNEHLTKSRTSGDELAGALQRYLALDGPDVSAWIKKFVERFLGDRPHPFILALQHPSPTILKGHVQEHQHLLKQWMKSLSWVVARADGDDVVSLELDNIATKYGGLGLGRPSHYELLLRMGESLGLRRDEMARDSPLPDAAHAMSLAGDWGH